MFQNDGSIVVHLLAEDFDTDIDHHLDEIRFHRSRVNFINKVEPIGISETVKIEANSAPVVYTPFNDEPAQISSSGNIHTIVLPKQCSYALIHFNA